MINISTSQQEALEAFTKKALGYENLAEDHFQKHDQSKPPLADLPTAQLEQVAQVIAHGAAKYSHDNWKKGCTWRRMASAALRHIFAWIRGEDKDADSGLPHLAHAVCCLLFLMWYQDEGKGRDDR